MKRLFIGIGFLLNWLILHAQAEIPFNQALGVYEGTRDEYKHISPFWGMVAIHGMLEQIRFFGNYEKVKKDVLRPEQEEAIVTEVDEGRDPIAQLIQELFPSPDGIQFVANTRDKDPVGGLSRNLGKINNLIEILLDKISQKQKINQIESLLHGEGNDNNITRFANILVKAYQRQDSLANPKKNPNQQLYPENIVIISLLGFFAKVADSKKDFAKLTFLMKEDFDQTRLFTLVDYQANTNNLKTTMDRAQNSPELLFLMGKGYDSYENPFMKPIPYRGDTCFKTSLGFPDCGETSLRNIFILLLGQNGIITKEALDHLQSKIDPIDGMDINDPSIPFQKLMIFFTNHPLLADSATKDSHSAWAEVVSDLNRQEEIGTLGAIQYGRGGGYQHFLYEIKSNFSNIAVKGVINMLNVIAKIIPDKQLNESWAKDENVRLQQAANKFTRFCEILSQNGYKISWENKHTHDQTLSSPFGILTFRVNDKNAYDWRFIPGHFQIESYPSNVTDWRRRYDAIPFPNEWLAFFYKNFNEPKLVEDDTYGTPQSLVFLYNSQLRSLDGALQTISFVLYKAITQDTLKQFVPLIARWIDISIPLNDTYAINKLSLILYSQKNYPTTNKAITDFLKKPKFAPVIEKINGWQYQNHNDVIHQMLQPNYPISSLVLMVHSLKTEKELSLNLTDNSTITDLILKKINDLAKLTSLHLRNNNKITDAVLQNLRNITSLDLANNWKITNASLQNLRNLTTLNLVQNSTITDIGLQNLPNLTSLNLAFNKTITDEGLQNLANLTSLNLSYNSKITDVGLQSLINLTFLDLENYNKITDTGFQNLTNLTSLDLSHNLTIIGAGLQNLTKLTSLNLRNNNKITDAVLQKLTNLSSLDLSDHNKITDEGLQNLTNLISLTLVNNRIITNAGLQNLTNLISLNLANNRTISDAGLKNLTNLLSLNLSQNNKITDKGLQNLTQLTSLNLADNREITGAALQNLPNLASLHLEHNWIISNEFIQRHPHIRITRR